MTFIDPSQHSIGDTGETTDLDHVYVDLGLLLQKSDNLASIGDPGSARANVHVPALTPAACVVTTNVSTMSGLNTYDGYQTVAGDLILLTGQSTASQNGLWTAASGSWTRPTEMGSGVSMKARTVAIIQGTTNGGSTWLLKTNTAVIVDTTAQTWVNQLPASVVTSSTQFANVTSYGATGNGTTDDSAAFQAAANTGLPVIIPNPSASYLIGSSIVLTTSTSRIWIAQGVENGASTIVFTGTGHCFEVVSTTPNLPSTSITNLIFQGIVISGNNGTTSTGGWNLNGTFKVKFIQCDASKFANASASGFTVQNSFNVSFDECLANTNGAYGYNITGGSSDNQITNIAIRDSFAFNNGTANISISPLVTLEGFVIENSAISMLATGIGLSITGKIANISLRNNHWQYGGTGTNTSVGISVSGSNLYLFNFEAFNNDFYTVGTLFSINGSAGTCQNVQIDGVYATGAGGFTTGQPYNFNTVTGFVWIGGSSSINGTAYATASSYTSTTLSVQPRSMPSLSYDSSQSANFTAQANYFYSISSAVTVTLPTGNVGSIVGICRAATGVSVVVDPDSGSTIAGSASATIGSTAINNHPFALFIKVTSTLWLPMSVFGTDLGMGWRFGNPVNFSSGIGLGASAASVVGTVSSIPPSSATIQTALGNLALGTNFHNTLGYDVWLTVYLAVTADTSLVVADGVGSSSGPTQTTVITGTTATGIVPVRAKIPAGYFRLLSVSGTATDAIVGQYLEAA